jgi:polar amino acid transport system substrate-binding protein
MFRKMLLLACLTATVMATPATTQAQEVLDRIVQSGVFRVGTTGTQPPFSAKDRQGELMGYEIELAKALAEVMDVEIQFVERPFAQLMGALENGDIDAIMSGMTITPQRNRRVAFVGPYLVSGKSILTKSATIAAAREATDIDQSSVRMAALDNSTSQTFVETIFPEAQAIWTEDYDEAVDLVLTDQADAVVADFPVLALAMLRNPNAGLATLTTPLTVEPIGMAVPAGDALLLNMIENYLEGLALSGALAELETYWFENGSWVAALH